MIIIKQGNIVDAKEPYIIDCRNCQGQMRSGVAKELKIKYPLVYQEYYNKWKNTKDKKSLLGQIQYVPAAYNTTIIGIFGQFNYGYDKKQYLNYSALFKGLLDITKEVNGDIALPYKIGCGRAGGRWSTVYSFLKAIAQDFEFNIVLYKYDKEDKW